MVISYLMRLSKKGFVYLKNHIQICRFSQKYRFAAEYNMVYLAASAYIKVVKLLVYNVLHKIHGGFICIIRKIVVALS